MNLLRKTEAKAVAHKSTCEKLCAVTLLLQGKGCHIPATGCQSHFLWSSACRHVDVSTRMNEFKYNRLNVMKICIDLQFVAGTGKYLLRQTDWDLVPAGVHKRQTAIQFSISHNEQHVTIPQKK